MLSDISAHPVLAVKDLERAKAFYEQTLGLEKLSELPAGAVFYKIGNGKIQVYVSGMASTNQATAMSWEVDDVESVVDSLKNKGVTFEHYDIEGVTRQGDIHTMGGIKAAWFKDPDGNILCVGNEG